MNWKTLKLTELRVYCLLLFEGSTSREGVLEEFGDRGYRALLNMSRNGWIKREEGVYYLGEEKNKKIFVKEAPQKKIKILGKIEMSEKNRKLCEELEAMCDDGSNFRINYNNAQQWADEGGYGDDWRVFSK